MAILASALALGFLLQTPAPPQAASDGSISLFNESVSVEAPEPGVTELPQPIKAWAGWGGLGTELVSPAPFTVNGDWSSVIAAQGAMKRDNSATPFRVRVILLPSVDLLFKTPAGNLDERRTSINAPVRTRIEQALALAAEMLQVQTGGRLSVVYDSSIDSALYEERVDTGDALGVDAINSYVTPRINGGSFEANDKRYHGPYNLCLVIHAGLSESVSTVVCGTPVLAFSAQVADESTSACAKKVIDAFGVAAQFAAERQGLHGPDSHIEPLSAGYAFGDQSPDQIVTDVGFGPVSGEDFVKNFRAEPFKPKRFEPAILRAANLSGNAQLSVGNDPTKGSILSLKLPSLYPSGGFVIPTPKDLNAVISGPKHFLTFDFRTNSHDSICVGEISKGMLTGSGVTLGSRSDPGAFADAASDGAWHKIAIDLKQACTSGDASGLYLGFSPQATRIPRNSMISGSYDFANFAFASATPDGAAPIKVSAGPPWDTEATAARAVAAASTPEGVLALSHVLDSPNETIRLNALDALAAVKLPALEDKIAASIGNINPRITEAAAVALAFQDTPTAWATLSKTVSIGPGTHAKAVASGLVAQRKDPSSSGPISAIQGAARDWHDRELATRALAVCGGVQAWLFLYSSLADDDPEIREVATTLIDPTDDTGMHRLMFVSVNDASDAVRAEACIKLLQSATPEVKREGYRGATDDSWWVRGQVLDWIAAHPSADDRAALRQAITSPYSQVRQAALDAFSASQAPVTLDEISNVVHDQTPTVQMAVLRLAKVKGLTLPADVVAGLKASVDSKVAAAAATLANN